AQDKLFSKILRIDVDGDSEGEYGLPAGGNPLVGMGNHLPETWAWGLRNPWRFSFDRQSGDLWIGDAGVAAWEEINLGVAGANYGWDTTEGEDCFNPDTGCDTTGITSPTYSYAYEPGGSVIGGYVYRGCAMPDL